MTHIICFGNLWAGDDGFGIHLYRELARRMLPSGVRLFDAGLAGLSALGCFDGCERAIVVDALRSEAEAGTILRLTAEEVALHYPATAHGLGVGYLLRVLAIAFEGQPLPEVVVLAATIRETRAADDTLSPPLRAALARMVAMIEKELVTCRVGKCFTCPSDFGHDREKTNLP